LDFNLNLPTNLTFRGEELIEGVLVKHYYYEFSFNTVADYYFTMDGKPFRFRFSSGSETVIDFLDFGTDFNDTVFDVPDIDCYPITVSTDRESYHKFLRITEVSKAQVADIESEFSNPIGDNLTIDPATLTLIGSTLWNIVKENKPVSNLDTNVNAIIPKGATWTDMAGWHQQKWNGWEWVITNPYGIQTVKYSWGFAFLCNGNYQGIGQYLENAGAFPQNIDVLWGYTVNVVTSLANPFNAGTVKSPVAGITLTMTMETSTLVSKVVQKCTVNLKGDCGTEVINCSGYKFTERFLYF